MFRGVGPVGTFVDITAGVIVDKPSLTLRRRRRRQMAVGKIVAGVAAGLGLVGVGYAGLAGQDDTTRDDAGQIVEGGELGALRIRVGDCFLDPMSGSTIEAVDAVPCSQPHMFEVYAAFNLAFGTDDPFPGGSAVDGLVDDGCYSRFFEFVGLGYEESIFDFSALYPTNLSWDEVDDREVLCLISNHDGSMKSGTARNARI
jgi:hypothetical protein